MIWTDGKYDLEIGRLFDLKKCDIPSLKSQINPNSIDLTIDRYIKRPVSLSAPVDFELRNPEEYKQYTDFYWKSETVEENIILKPGDCVLACTREYVTMPTDCCGQLFTKSSLGRMFINHMMAGVVDAGFNGKLTLELKNDGVHIVKIPVAARVVQLIVYTLDEMPKCPYGERINRYHNAATVESAKQVRE
jgi:dCTP deaminase